MQRFPFVPILLLGMSGCFGGSAKQPTPLGELPTAVTTAEPEWVPFRVLAGQLVAADPREQHLRELRQLTTDGTEGAVAWSEDGQRLLYLWAVPGNPCARMRMLELRTGRSELLPPTSGWVGSAVFSPGQKASVLVSFAASPAKGCPALEQSLRGRLLPLPPSRIYALDLGSRDLEPIVVGAAFEGGLAASVAARKVVFTSTRSGDPELYLARADGTEVQRITDAVGYDGGATFSPDGTKLAWHAERPAAGALATYRERLASGIVEPERLGLMLAGAEGQHPLMLLDDGELNMSPAFFPDSRRILLASNRDGGRGSGDSSFDLYAIDPDGPPTLEGHPALERVTYYDGFDGAPAWSPDGKHVAFLSSRYAAKPGQTNLFVARWQD
jgi:TolB protein